MTKAKKQVLEKPVWLKYSEDEVRAIITKMANKGMTSEKIGLALRDQYGIPKAKIFNIKIGKVLMENNKQEDPNIINLTNKLNKLMQHYDKNKQDKKAHRSLTITKAKLKKRHEYKEKKSK